MFYVSRIGHLAPDCTNTRIVTLAEWEAIKEEEIEEEKEKEVMENIEEVKVKADDGEMLNLSRSHHPKSHEHLSLFPHFW